MNRVSSTQFSAYDNHFENDNQQHFTRVSDIGLLNHSPALVSPFIDGKIRGSSAYSNQNYFNGNSMRGNFSATSLRGQNQSINKSYFRNGRLMRVNESGYRENNTQYNHFRPSQQLLHSEQEALHSQNNNASHTRAYIKQVFNQPSNETHSTNAIVEMFSLQQNEYNKLLEVNIDLREQIKTMLQHLNGEHNCINKFIQFFNKLESDQQNQSTQEQSPNLCNADQKPAAAKIKPKSFQYDAIKSEMSKMQFDDSILPVDLIKEGKKVYDETEQFFNQLAYYNDLKCFSQFRGSFGKQNQNQQKEQGKVLQEYQTNSEVEDEAPLTESENSVCNFGQKQTKDSSKGQRKPIKNFSLSLKHECMSPTVEAELHQSQNQVKEESQKSSISFAKKSMEIDKTFQSKNGNQEVEIKVETQVEEDADDEVIDISRNRSQFEELMAMKKKYEIEKLRQKIKKQGVVIISQDLPTDMEDIVENDIDLEDDEEDENYSLSKLKKKKQKKLKRKSLTAVKQEKLSKVISKRTLHNGKLSKKPSSTIKHRYVCIKCNEVFTSGWALGGHASRVHPGESDSYKKKIERREQRVIERQLLQMAKEKHAQEFGKEAPINRVKIRKYKKDFKKHLYGSTNFNTKELIIRLQNDTKLV
ncbi:UNKNOWN [Stylonychia lemnae]|uniref:C2H2-type domain-containing protein n=1 Tax=Stylonychia lemnae TaxID=5949 RepID=A0A078AEL0_STYLE|nr:UNKNOWN [Stylonychia lemnae]|eukprot:CDW80709.1 UNKNOWN [Stylonychia lemnae]